MKVRATKLGYYNHRRRRENDVFELMDEKAFSNRWMEKVEGEDSAPEPKPKAEKKAPEAPAASSSEEVI